MPSHLKRQSGAELIAAERDRQVSAEGWTPEHDDQHTRGELAKAAGVYAMPFNGSWKLANWPWPDGLKPAPPTTEARIRELEKAGALIAAEIDRLKRRADADDQTRVAERLMLEGRPPLG